MRAKEFLQEKIDVELEIEDLAAKQHGSPQVEDGMVMIPPLQQALEIEKAKLEPTRAKKSKAIRQLLRKDQTQYLPNQPK